MVITGVQKFLMRIPQSASIPKTKTNTETLKHIQTKHLKRTKWTNTLWKLSEAELNQKVRMVITKTNNSARSFWHMNANEFRLSVAHGVHLSQSSHRHR